MIAEIIATGEEIRTGALADTNSACIAQALEECGVEVTRLNGVGDDLHRLSALLKEVGGRADVCVVTGGLGPTVDDLSAEAAAEAAGVGLRLDPSALESIEAFFRTRKRPMNPSIRKQAMLPEGADVLFNPVGTAPGFSLKVGGCLCLFLPGVPFEMKRMLADQVVPRITALTGGPRDHRLIKTLSCFGLTESLTGERLTGLGAEFPGVRLGLRAKFPEIQVKLYAGGADEAGVSQQLEKAAGWARRRLGDIVFSDSGEPMEAAVGGLLRQRQATLAVAESCTGGLISHLLTEIAGSSDYLLFSAVTYANHAKTAVLFALGGGARGHRPRNGRRRAPGRRGNLRHRHDRDCGPDRRLRGKAGRNGVHRPGLRREDPGLPVPLHLRPALHEQTDVRDESAGYPQAGAAGASAQIAGTC
jgi:nicotinamide-nucleotide amidase